MVESFAGPQITAVNTSNANHGLDNGEAAVIADGQALPLRYSIDGIIWQSSNIFTGLPAGTDTTWVRDANGCLASAEFIVLRTVDGLIELAVDTLNYCMNLPVIVPIDASDFTGVASFVIELDFDPAVLSFIELLNENSALENGTFSISISGNKLQIRYSVFSGAISLPNGEQLFSLHFEGLAAGLSGLSWNLLQCSIYTETGYAIPSIFTPGLAEILPVPSVYTAGAGEYCEGDTLTLHSGSLDAQVLDYEWTSPTGFKHRQADWQLGQLGINDNGEFRLSVTNLAYCNSSQSVPIKVNPKPNIYIGYADTICYGTQVLLDPGSGYVSYLWQDGSSAPSKLVYEEGIYWVQVVDTNSCRGVDTVQVVPCNIELLIPNAFSPDNDGLNDTFKPLFRGFEPNKYRMTIYSKWGQKIFSTTDTQVGWDGTMDGKTVMVGTYAYVVVYEAPSFIMRTLPSPVTGEVTLIR